MDNEALVHTRTELDRVLVNVEAAVKVRKRADFFSWVQGVFQGMIAHEVLICGLPTPAANGLRFEWLASYPSPDDLVRELCRAQDGLLYRLISLWLQGGRLPLVLQAAPSGSRTAGKGSLADELRDLDLGNCVAHGLPSLEGQPAGFFAFFRLPTEPGSHELRMLELLLPYLHAAWLRANCDMATQGSVQTVAAREILTAREVEILHWVERGKSNNEIAQILNISHLTVKNHVQKILRKLNVQNRAQAVAKGINLNLTHPAGGGRYD
jgi:transcriptional regulator EpsA